MASYWPVHEEIEQKLLTTLTSSRQRYEAAEGSIEDYLEALKQFAEFVLEGIVPVGAKSLLIGVLCGGVVSTIDDAVDVVVHLCT